MSGTGAVTVNGATVYAYFDDTAGRALRLRVSADDAERHQLAGGHTCGVGLPGQAAGPVLVTATDWAPPFVWLELRPLARTAG